MRIAKASKTRKESFSTGSLLIANRFAWLRSKQIEERAYFAQGVY